MCIVTASGLLVPMVDVIISHMEARRITPIRAAVGAEIRAGRARKKWTQEELAAQAGVSLSTVQRIEGGRAPVDVADLIAFGDALGIDPRTLFKLALAEVRKEEGGVHPDIEGGDVEPFDG